MPGHQEVRSLTTQRHHYVALSNGFNGSLLRTQFLGQLYLGMGKQGRRWPSTGNVDE
jgi:hypothetical protein